MDTTVEFHKIPQTIAIIRNFYTFDELQLVWKELDVICSPFLLQPAEETGSAFDDKSESFLKKGNGLFIDRIYEGRRDRSNILTIGRKIFDKSFLDDLIQQDPNFKHIQLCDSDHTLVNYYEGGDEYKQHSDRCVFTANVVLWREPKMFDGGVFLMGDGDNVYDFKLNSNDMVIFPGYTLHAVTPITMIDGYSQWHSGRYSIANFISYC